MISHTVEATKPAYRNYQACGLQLLKPTHSRAHVPQQEKPPQGEAHAQQWESSPHLLQLEKSPSSGKNPAQP